MIIENKHLEDRLNYSYVVWRQVASPLGGWEEPYIFAICANSRSCNVLLEISKRQNPDCRHWKSHGEKQYEVNSTAEGLHALATLGKKQEKVSLL